jgi:hypothetical protein
LIVGTFALWLVLLYPAHWKWGMDGVYQSVAALLLCLLPTMVTLVWTSSAGRGSPERQLTAVVGGTGLRMAFVLAGGLALHYLFPVCHQMSFWIWVLLFYLFTLALETYLVLGGQEVNEPRP